MLPLRGLPTRFLTINRSSPRLKFFPTSNLPQAPCTQLSSHSSLLFFVPSNTSSSRHYHADPYIFSSHHGHDDNHFHQLQHQRHNHNHNHNHSHYCSHQHRNRCRRPFTTSLHRDKKHQQNFRGAAKDQHYAHSSETPSTTNTKLSDANDPFDLSRLETAIADALARLKDEVSKLTAGGGGGKFDPRVLEGLKVSLKSGGGGGSADAVVRLGELSQVVPRAGRMMVVLVGDEEHVKPIASAITASDLSLNPQTDPHNPLQINVPVPPPTKESRERLARTVKTAADKASNAVRDARGSQHKKIKAVKGRADDIRKAHDMMEKIARKGQEDVRSVMTAAQKAVEGG